MTLLAMLHAGLVLPTAFGPRSAADGRQRSLPAPMPGTSELISSGLIPRSYQLPFALGRVFGENIGMDGKIVHCQQHEPWHYT